MGVEIVEMIRQTINSDSEGAGTRSFSYKVLMQTGATELEMRGRCSGGQNPLKGDIFGFQVGASLIIRLASACFASIVES
ncbi:hypothetical protein MLD38_020427 [Melastoma candidum]|uniref:Uncharacterized protein n=1 Tax=Melastoma candidum TaxID=119954 RepID=A0ACB9QER3_9MYRT|nr:hypothetical protein MLD38_020427 [Melastoma candidum]